MSSRLVVALGKDPTSTLGDVVLHRKRGGCADAVGSCEGGKCHIWADL